MVQDNVVHVRLRFDHTVGPLPLVVGVHNRIVVSLPRFVEYIRAAGFSEDSAFPGPGLAAALKSVQEAVDGTAAKLLFFGHSDASGTVASNKNLSDRRASAMRALFLSDADALLSIAEDEGWGVREYQTMLRALGYVAGAIDGELGPMTACAIEAFAREHGFREHPGAPPPTSTQSLDDLTCRSILWAYALEYGYDMPAGVFFGSGSVGCCDFNIPSEAPTLARAVSLAVIDDGADAEDSGKPPCRTGDASACRVDRDAHPRCGFFRTFVVPQPFSQAFDFFDFRWTRTPTGKVHLSALTTAPDTDEAVFRIGIAANGLKLPPASSSDGQPEPPLQKLAEIPGMVRNGICYALWDASDFNPFDIRHWSNLEAEGEPVELEGLPVPTFRVQVGSSWAYAPPPGRPLHRIFAERDTSSGVLALLSDGTFVRVDSTDTRLAVDYDPALHVVALYTAGGLLTELS